MLNWEKKVKTKQNKKQKTKKIQQKLEKLSKELLKTQIV